ncbi:MAG TPA: T9SS type A sorting domain-containing protein [Ignavibacteriaceae bacterium]
MKARYTFLFIFLGLTLVQAQPLNNDFESWTSDDPTDWFTGDIPGLVDAVSQSGSAYNGSSCVKLEVSNFGGTAYPPYLSTLNSSTSLGHPVSMKHGSLHGYYKLNPLGNDALAVVISMNAGAFNAVGAGGGILTTASSWTEFNLPIYYTPGSADPDNVIIYFVIADTAGGTATIGSEGYVDYIDLTAPSSVEQLSGLPEDYTLSQNYPNPFNPSTNIEYSIPEQSFVDLRVYDILGNEVAELVNEEQSAGTYKADFIADNLASGLYIAQLKTGNFSKTIKMTLLR